MPFVVCRVTETETVMFNPLSKIRFYIQISISHCSYVRFGIRGLCQLLDKVCGAADIIL